jgi:hypothetical protein
VEELVDELVGLLDELLPLLPELELVTDGVVTDVLVELPETLDDDPLPVMEVELVSEEEGEPKLEEVCVVVAGILPVTRKPQFFSTKEWVYDKLANDYLFPMSPRTVGPRTLLPFEHQRHYSSLARKKRDLRCTG